MIKSTIARNKTTESSQCNLMKHEWWSTLHRMRYFGGFTVLEEPVHFSSRRMIKLITGSNRSKGSCWACSGQPSQAYIQQQHSLPQERAINRSLVTLTGSRVGREDRRQQECVASLNMRYPRRQFDLLVICGVSDDMNRSTPRQTSGHRGNPWVAMDTVHRGVAEEGYKSGAVIEDLWDWTLYLQTGTEHLTITISFMKEV